MLIKKFILLVLIIIYNSQLFGQNVVVDPDVRFQEIEGWGSSLSWWANIVGDTTHWSEDVIDQLCDELTSPSELNMNIWRYNIHGGDNPEEHGEMLMGTNSRIRQLSDQSYTHFRWDSGKITSYKSSENADYDWSANSSQRKILMELLERNPNAILDAQSNSPPYWMTISGCSAGNGGLFTLSLFKTLPNLSGAHVDNFANYLTDVVKHYKDEYGITFRTLTGFNEPSANFWNFGGTQEGCRIPIMQQKKFIERLYIHLRQKNMLSYCTISSSDENKIDETWKVLNVFKDDGKTLNYITQINTHDYYSDDQQRRSEVAEFAEKHNLRLWQSESGPLEVTIGGFDKSLYMAETIITNLNDLRANAWIDWQIVSTSSDWGLYTFEYQGSEITNYKLTKTKSYYLRKQFSKYIKQGYRIIKNNGNNMLTALSKDKKELVIITINKHDTNSTQNIDLSKFHSVHSTAFTLRTSRNENAQELIPTKIVNNVLSYTSPPKSITTFVIPVLTYSEPTGIREGLYHIKAKHSNKYMAVKYLSIQNGANIVQWDKRKTDNFIFLIQKIGNHYVISPRNSNKVLSINYESTQVNAILKQWDNLDRKNQRFYIKLVSGRNEYKIANVNSGLYLAVKDSGMSNGNQIVQVRDSNSNNLKWVLEPVPPTLKIPQGDYYIKSKLSGKFVSVQYHSSSNNANLKQWEYVDRDNLRFTITPTVKGFHKISPVYNSKIVSVYRENIDNGAILNIYDDLNGIFQKFDFTKVENNFYKITPQAYFKKALHIIGEGINNGDDVRLWEYNNKEHFKWEVIPVSKINNIKNGIYRIMAINTNKYMHLKNNYVINGTPIDLTSTENIAQKFEIIKEKDGYYKIKPIVDKSKVVTINGEKTVNGTIVNIYKDLNRNNQKFIIQEVDENSYKIIPKNAPASAVSKANGDLVNLWKDVNNTNSLWAFEPSFETLKASALSKTNTNNELIDNSININIFPNPTRDNLTVNNPDIKNMKLEIFDFNGFVKLTKQFNERQIEISLNTIVQPGTYLFRFTSDNNMTLYKKIVLKR